MKRAGVHSGLVGLMLSLPSLAQAAAIALEEAEILVKGQTALGAEETFSATRIDRLAVRDARVSDVTALFRVVPGMAVRELGLPGVAGNIVIRGFGAGGHGGDLGAVVDGIPLNEAMSHADGYVDFNVIIPLEVETMTVFRGPVSALYGNYNRGGLVNIQTRRSGEYRNAEASVGAFDTVDVQAALGTALGASQRIDLAAQIYRSNGFRPQSMSDRQTVSAHWAADVSAAVQVALFTRFHHADAEGASYITAAQFETDPYGLDPRVQNDGARKTFRTHRADVNVALGASATLMGFAYVTQQDFTRWFSRPLSGVWKQREETYDRAVFGAGASLVGDIAPGPRPLRYTVGLEHFRERTDYQYYDDLSRRVRLTAALADRRTRLNSVSAFAELDAPLHSLVEATLGLRLDRFTGGCSRRGPETGSDPCGPLAETTEFSPKIGLRSQVAPWLQLRGSWAEGFALPNSFVKYAVGGQDLKANIFRQTELGVKLIPAETVSLDVAAFRLTSANEVRTVAPGLYENFGKTLRKGLEASLEARPLRGVWLRGAYSRTTARVRENADAALVGLSVAGVPRHTATVDASWSPVKNWTLEAGWRLVGGYAVDALNRLRADSYDTLALGLSWQSGPDARWRAYVRAENVTDAKYATTVSVIGGETLLAPGAPRAVRGGVQVTF